VTSDIVGVGAINVDYLVRGPAPGGEWGTEHRVDAATVEALVPRAHAAALGGSAFNTLYAIANARTGLRLGFVGVAGRVPVCGPSALDAFDRFGIDRRFVFPERERLCGVCVSFLSEGERTLLTHAGANDAFADHLVREGERVVEYLAGARLVHVTSFLDDRSAGILRRVLEAVKAISPGSLISFDPGHVWSTERTPDVDGIVRLCDFLLVNRIEYREAPGAVVVEKRPAEIRWTGPGGSGSRAQTPLSTNEIVDATGAGDVFAAGLLIELAKDPGRIEAGCELGMRLARHKLRHVGSTGHADLARLVGDGA
jgi:sugar/nucleoside kinase (ribokinase family)